MNPALDSRARFEAKFSAAPYGYNMRRDDEHPDGYHYWEVDAAWEAWQAAIASMAVIDPETGAMATWCRDLIEGMSVSVDVSTGDHDAGHRYFGTVTEVMDDPNDKHGVTLLVQDAAPNFQAPVAGQPAEPSPRIAALEEAAREMDSLFRTYRDAGDERMNLYADAGARIRYLKNRATPKGDSNG